MSFNFANKMREFRSLKRTLPVQVANLAKNHYLEGFRKGGFTDNSFKAWKKRKAKTRRNAGRAILVDSGALRRSIRTISASWTKIQVGSTGLAYASRHNQGLDDMPKRQFIGASGVLRKKIKKLIDRKVKEVML